MEDVFEEILKIQAEGKKAALASLIWSSGSIPMSEQAKMLVKENGRIVGTIGGGCLEAEVWSAGQEVIKEGVPRILRYHLTEKHVQESGLICGGTVRIFVEPIRPGAMEDLFQEIAHVRVERDRAVLATVVSEGDELAEFKGKFLVREDGRTVGSLGSDRLNAAMCAEVQDVMEGDLRELRTLELDDREARDLGRSPGSELEIFVEAFLLHPTVYIFGGGHISLSLATMAKMVGFRVVVVDDRPGFANSERFPLADEVMVEPFEGVFEKLEIDGSSCIVSVTRGHQHDEIVIEQAVRTGARYIGMIGSRRKIATLWRMMSARGTPRELLDRVHAPIGLDIGADTPEEIAVSIVAEMILARRGEKRKRKQKV